MFYPTDKTIELRGKITNLKRNYSESLFKAWERYKYLIQKCPKHGLSLWSQIHPFYNGLNDYTKGNIDTAPGGAIGKKTYIGALEIFELLSKQSM